MSSIRVELNPSQREAVQTLDGPVMILAGAGTGKTRTIIYRMGHLLEKGVLPEQLLAVTFTNKAACEMRERLEEMLGAKLVKSVMIGTFHSLCVQILRRGIECLGYKSKFSIVSGSDQKGLIQQIIVEQGGAKEKLKPQDVLSVLSQVKNGILDKRQIADDLVVAIIDAYQKELKLRNAVDFDDLLLLSVQLLQEHPKEREYWREKFTHITVDEFQDTNGCQMELLHLLTKEPFHICVVGDDDQSIYGWRGAQVENLLQFDSMFEGAKVIKLEDNYRSTQSILEISNTLIKHNAQRRDKQLRSQKIGGQPVKMLIMPHDNKEAAWVADDIDTQHKAQKREWEDIAVLFRTNGQIRKVEHALRELQIPYRMIGAQSFYDRREVKDLLAYLEILINPDADIPLLRVIKRPARGIGDKIIGLALETSREYRESVWKTLQSEHFYQLISTRAQNAVQTFVEQVNNCRIKIEEEPQNTHAIFKEWLDEMGYTEWMHRQCKTPEEITQRDEGIYEVLFSLESSLKHGETLQKFIDQVALMSDNENEDLDKKKGVSLITLHASKGLEYPVVYLVGLEQGILPHSRSVSEGNLDEERRLLYVGMTRAQDELYLSYCLTRRKYGDVHGCEPSSFIKEFESQADPLIGHLEIINYEEEMNRELDEDEVADFFDTKLFD